MWIDHSDSAPLGYIVKDHIFEERGFTHTGFPDHVKMPATVIGTGTEFE